MFNSDTGGLSLFARDFGPPVKIVEQRDQRGELIG
jgi:hypothetical protein